MASPSHGSQGRSDTIPFQGSYPVPTLEVPVGISQSAPGPRGAWGPGGACLVAPELPLASISDSTGTVPVCSGSTDITEDDRATSSNEDKYVFTWNPVTCRIKRSDLTQLSCKKEHCWSHSTKIQVNKEHLFLNLSILPNLVSSNDGSCEAKLFVIAQLSDHLVVELEQGNIGFSLQVHCEVYDRTLGRRVDSSDREGQVVEIAKSGQVRYMQHLASQRDLEACKNKWIHIVINAQLNVQLQRRYSTSLDEEIDCVKVENDEE